MNDKAVVEIVKSEEFHKPLKSFHLLQSENAVESVQYEGSSYLRIAVGPSVKILAPSQETFTAWRMACKFPGIDPLMLPTNKQIMNQAKIRDMFRGELSHGNMKWNTPLLIAVGNIPQEFVDRESSSLGSNSPIIRIAHPSSGFSFRSKETQWRKNTIVSLESVSQAQAELSGSISTGINFDSTAFNRRSSSDAEREGFPSASSSDPRRDNLRRASSANRTERHDDRGR